MCGCVRQGDADRQHTITAWRWKPSGGFALTQPDGTQLAYIRRQENGWYWSAGGNAGVEPGQIQAMVQAEVHGGDLGSTGQGKHS